MAAKHKTAEEQTALASAKQLRDRDAVLAMQEYQRERLEMAARTERLRALRMARDAGRPVSEKPDKRRRKPAGSMQNRG